MVAVGALTPAEAYGAADLNTIVLLLGMMIVVAPTRYGRRGVVWRL
jgi:Na+/H+ antiporter NhaD/arsenite permease-like protein